MIPQDVTAWVELADGSERAVMVNCLIGRSSTSHLVIDAVSVSRRHALIHQQGDSEYWLVDLGSSNGTKLNNRAVVHPVKLEDGDEILVGSEPVIFRCCAQQRGGDSALMKTIVNVGVSKKWLMIADIEGYTPMSQKLAPDLLAKTVGTWLAKTRSVVQKTGGDINKYLGDGWMAGWPDGEGVSGRVLECLEELEGMRSQSGPGFRLALHYGEVASSGFDGALDLSVMGAEVIYLFRMEKIAAGLKVKTILSQAAVDLLGEGCAFRPLGKHVVKGFPGEFAFYAKEGDDVTAAVPGGGVS